MSKNISFDTDDSINLDNVCIKLNIIDYNKYSKRVQRLLDSFISVLCGQIGANTNINYHAYRGAYKGNLLINIHYSNEKNKSTSEIIDDRFKTVVNYIQNIDLTTLSPPILKLVNNIIAENVNFNNILQISIVNTMNNEYIIPPCQVIIKHPVNFKRITVSRMKLHDDSSILIINDKCGTDYGIFVNLTQPFPDMGMSYNALHLYEHLMMRCFENLNQNDVLDENGATYPNANCFVYTVLKSKESFIKFLNNTIKTLYEVRDKDYWNKPNQIKDIKQETQRTISETRLSRTMIDFGRSDPNAYNDGYNIEIFKYWSNKPFDITIVGPDINHTFIDKHLIESLNSKHPINKINRPKNIKYSNMPLDVAFSKEFSKSVVQKYSKDYIHDLFIEPVKLESKSTAILLEDGNVDLNDYSYLYGIDNRFIVLNNSLSSYNSFMVPCVFINKLFNTDELESMFNKSNFPTTCVQINIQRYFENA